MEIEREPSTDLDHNTQTYQEDFIQPDDVTEHIIHSRSQSLESTMNELLPSLTKESSVIDEITSTDTSMFYLNFILYPKVISLNMTDIQLCGIVRSLSNLASRQDEEISVQVGDGTPIVTETPKST